MGLQARIARATAPLLDPGEQVELGFSCRATNRSLRIVVATNRRILVFRQAFLVAKPTGPPISEVPRSTQIGPPTGSVYSTDVLGVPLAIPRVSFGYVDAIDSRSGEPPDLEALTVRRNNSRAIVIVGLVVMLIGGLIALSAVTNNHVTAKVTSERSCVAGSCTVDITYAVGGRPRSATMHRVPVSEIKGPLGARTLSVNVPSDGSSPFLNDTPDGPIGLLVATVGVAIAIAGFSRLRSAAT